MTNKCIWLIAAIMVQSVTVLATASLDSNVTNDLPKTEIRRAWYSGFMGYINLPIEEDVEAGWRMILEFRRRIKYFEICGAQIEYVSDDKRRYCLVNETWDGVLYKGDILQMFFTADTFNKVRGQRARIQFLPISSSSAATTTELPTELSSATKMGVSGSPGVNLTTVWKSATMTSHDTSNLPTEGFTQSSSMTPLPSTASSTPRTTMPTTEAGYVCEQTCGSTTQINSEWSGNFGGALTIPITVDVTNGWTATIWFQNRVTSLQIYNAVARSSVTTDGGETVYTITNQSWNADLTYTPNLYLTFIASIPTQQSAQTFYVHMNGQPACACGA